MPYIALGLGLAIGLYLLGRWFVVAKPTTVIKFLRWTGMILLLLGDIFLAISGRLGWLIFLLPVVLPWIMRARQAARMAKNFSRMASGSRGAGTGQSSQIETRFLRMLLDHDSGEMNGQVLEGRFAGRQLADLSFDGLISLYGECAPVDEQSAQVLAAYLERNFPEDWRERAESAETHSGGASNGKSAMTRDEAYDVLGLEAGASTEEIKAAHHKLMSKIHPDHGGSTYLATKINQAKDFLLGD